MKKYFLALTLIIFVQQSIVAKDFWQAAKGNDKQTVKKYVDVLGTDINSKDLEGYSALHYAVLKGHIDLVKYLLEKGAKINSKTHSEKIINGEFKFYLSATPLHLACLHSAPEMVSLLLSMGADIHIPITYKTDKRIRSSNMGMNRKYMGGIPVYKTENIINYVLGKRRLYKTKKVLLQYNKSLPMNKKVTINKKFKTMGYYIILDDDVMVKEFMKKGENPAEYINIILELQSTKVLNLLLGLELIESNKFSNLLSDFVKENNLDMLKIFLSRVSTETNDTAILNYPLLRSVEKKNTEATKILLEAGANISFMGYNNQRIDVLQKAIHRKAPIETIELLLQYHDKKDFEKCVYEAVKVKNSKALRVLIPDIPDPNILFDGHNTLLFHFVRNGGEIRDYYWSDDFRNEMIQLLLTNNANPNTKDKDGMSPLTIATISNDLQAMELLLKHGADPNLSDDRFYTKHIDFSKDVTLLIYTVANNRIKAAKTLLKYGADINAQMKAGETSLMFAMSLGNEEMIQLLLDNKADINIQNKDGFKAEDFRKQNEKSKKSGFRSRY